MASMKAAQFTPGGPDKLYVDKIDRPSLKDNEILLRVFATAINRADTLQRKGKYPAPAGESDVLGLEAAGVMHTAGNGSTKWQPGERVMALLPGGGNAEYTAAHEDHVMSIPDGMSFTQAAAIPEVWLTAYQLLHFLGKVRSGDNVLIHAGGSGVGTAAIQLVKLANGTSFVTAGSQDKIDFAKSLGAKEGFNYKQGNFSDGVLAATNGKGVNLILDCVGSNYWEQNLDCIAMEGTWVLYGLLSGGNVEGPFLAKMLRKRAHLVSSTLRARSNQYKADLVSSFSENALPHFKDGKLKTIIHKVFPNLESISDAHQMMEDNSNTGKIIVLVQSDKEEL